MKDTAFYQSQSMEVNGLLVDFNKPLTMGVINVTPDSFYTGSRVAGAEAVALKAVEMVQDGADIIDIGAYSTRPGADAVPIQLELDLLTEAIAAVRGACPGTTISADTFRAKVARAAVDAGAHIINDVGGGLLDEAMHAAVAELGVPYILMHNRGAPKDMHEKAVYHDVVNEVVQEISAKLDALYCIGIADVIVDPGFGFAKTVAHNFEMLMRLEEFQVLQAPLMVGLSRKSMVWRTLGVTADEALNGTSALHMLALERGANILRVHDVREAVEVVKLWQACAALQ